MIRSLAHCADIFQQPISIFIDSLDAPATPDAPTALSVFVSAREKSRYTIKTGTEAGHAEGSAFLSVALRNIFSGASALGLARHRHRGMGMGRMTWRGP